MSARIENDHFGLTVALAGVLIPGLALATPPETIAPDSSSTADPSSATRFLSADGAVLPGNCPINPEAVTFLVVHGFKARGNSAPFLRQADAIRQRFPEANVVLVDWQVPPQVAPQAKPSGNPWLDMAKAVAREYTALHAEYGQAAKHCRRVGREIAEWIERTGIPPSRVVISGHSLGAQIASFASNECARPERFAEPVGVILAADPAGPLFRGNPPEQRLDSQDAHEVIVVHTTAMFGDENPIGTLDVYVDWPDAAKEPDDIWRHSQARELITNSFLDPEMASADGTAFGANALGY